MLSFTSTWSQCISRSWALVEAALFLLYAEPVGFGCIGFGRGIVSLVFYPKASPWLSRSFCCTYDRRVVPNWDFSSKGAKAKACPCPTIVVMTIALTHVVCCLSQWMKVIKYDRMKVLVCWYILIQFTFMLSFKIKSLFYNANAKTTLLCHKYNSPQIPWQRKGRRSLRLLNEI